jgi:hypothetical protein
MSTMNAARHPRRLQRQHGSAALIVTLLLFFAMTLAALFVNRNLLFEQRSAVNQARATQAFEAAEAGLEWATAQLNNSQRLGADCLVSTAGSALAFRERYLHLQRSTGRFARATWNSAGTPVPLRPSCVRDGDHWACSCPTEGAPSLPTPSDANASPAFALEFVAADQPGVVRVVSIGCTSASGACAADGQGSVDASARVEIALALVPGLRTPPAAALTARGRVDAGGAALGVHNPDPDSGVAIHAGSTISAVAARLTTPAGAGLGGALVANDAALAASSPTQHFAAYFGMSPTQWRQQPGVHHIDCSAGCTSALQRAIDESGTSALIWVDGDLTLDGPMTIASPQRPAIVIASGSVHLTDAVRFHGVLYGAGLSWNGTPSAGSLLRGALMSELHYEGTGAPDLFYDTEVLWTLQHNSGHFARVAGSWRDF